MVANASTDETAEVVVFVDVAFDVFCESVQVFIVEVCQTLSVVTRRLQCVMSGSMKFELRDWRILRCDRVGFILVRVGINQP